MDFRLYAPESLYGGRFENLLNPWVDTLNTLRLFEELLKTDIDIRLKWPYGYEHIYDPDLDGKYEEEVLDLLKEYRPELYYEIMLGIKQ